MTEAVRLVSVARLLAPFRSPGFCLMWTGQLIALVGIQGYLIAQSWLVLQHTGATTALGTLLALIAGPRAVLLPIGGMLSDRLHPRRVLIASAVVFAALAGVLGQSLVLDSFELWHLMICAVLFGVMSALCLPALFAALPMHVDGPHLQSANSLAQIAMQGSQFVGPALAGVAIEAMGIDQSYGVLTLVFGLSALLIGFAPRPAAAAGAAANRGSTPGGLGECVALFRRERRLLGLALLTMLTNFGLGGPLQVALPALAHGSLRIGVDGLGLLLTMFGAGTLTGSLAAGGMSQRTNRMRIALAAGMISGISWAALATTSSLAITLVILIVTGACLGVLNVLFLTQVQSLTPGHLLGRVMGIQLVGSMGLQPISFLLASWSIDHVGLAPVFLAGGTLVAVTCLALMPSWK